MNHPSSRMMALAWVAALLLVALLIGGTHVAAQNQLIRLFEGRSTAFVGTSLMRYAVSNANDGSTILHLGKGSFLRAGIPSASETQMLGLAQAAVEAQVGTLFIEVNPIVTRFALKNQGCGLAFRLEQLITFIEKVARPTLKGRDFLNKYLAEPPGVDPSGLDQSRIAASYPLSFPPLCHEAGWRALSARARSTRIVLVAMPRSPLARELVGEADMAHFHSAATALAQDLGMQLYIVDPAGTWESDLFLDQAHVNRRGSEKFLMALDAWLTEQS